MKLFIIYPPATTNSFGRAYFDLNKLKHTGTYTFTIDIVAETGFTFDPENSVLSASLIKVMVT